MRTAGVTLGAIGLTACFTALLRLIWDPLWPLLAAYSHMPALRFLVLLVPALLLPLIRVLTDRWNWSMTHVGVVVVTGAVIGYLAAGLFIARRQDAPLSGAEHQYMIRLYEVARPHIDFDELSGGMIGTCIPVVDDRDVGAAARRLRAAILGAYDDRFMHHIIVVGGPQTPLADRTLRKAVRWLPKCRNARVPIIVVVPSPISEDVEQAFEGRGLRIKEIVDEFLDSSLDRRLR